MKAWIEDLKIGETKIVSMSLELAFLLKYGMLSKVRDQIRKIEDHLREIDDVIT